MTLIHGFDVSHWQEPAAFDWEKTQGEFMVARATYGAKTLDRNFTRWALEIRGHGLAFGAYLFYRQIHDVETQHAAFEAQLAKAGGLGTGDLYPVLDMEPNAQNGDGKPDPDRFGPACEELARRFREAYGGVILYYSSFFPEYLGVGEPLDSGNNFAAWMNEPGNFHWLADYDRVAGSPRHPYTPEWHLHQPRPRKVPEYAKGQAVIDVDVDNGAGSLGSLVIGAPC